MIFILSYYIHCFEWWCQKFLPAFSSMSVALLCSLLTLFKGCTSSSLIFLGRTPWDHSRLLNASLLISVEFNQQKASLSPMWSLRVLTSLAEQGMHRFLRITLKFKVQRRSVKCQKLLHSLASFPSSKFLCAVHHIQWGTVRLPSHPLSKFFVLSVLCPVFFVVIQSCWNNKLQAVYSSFFISLS